MTGFLAAVTPLLITYNEIDNLARTLAGLRWARRIVVMDSGSTDGTLDLLAADPRIVVLHRKFDDFARQCQAGLAAIDTPWVLSMDADYRIPDPLAAEIDALSPADAVAGFQIGFRWSVHGQLLRGALYPPRVMLHRVEGARYYMLGHGHRVAVDGRVEALRHWAIHDDRKSLARWLASQDKYATQEAATLQVAPWASLRWQAKARRLMFVTPWLVPLYCLTVQRGLLDGKAGWHYALQRGIAEAIIALKLVERRLGLTPPD